MSRSSLSRGTFKKSMFERLKEGFIKYVRAFKKDKSGLFGLGLLGLLFTMVVAGLTAYPDANLNEGSGPKFAAPRWLAPFDTHEFKFDEALVKSDFNEERDVERTFDDTSTTTTHNGKYVEVSVEHSEEKGALATRFRDKNPSDPINESGMPGGRVIYTKNIEWDKRPPNGVEIEFAYKFEGNFDTPVTLYGNQSVYNTSIGLYLNTKAFRTVDAMVNYLNTEVGMGLSERQYDSKHGVKLSYPKVPVGTFIWRKGGLDLARRNVIVLFREFKDIELNFVVEYNIRDNRTEVRAPGDVSVYLGNVDIKARGYYSGLMGTTDVGADLFGLIAHGMTNSLALGLTATVVTLSIGIVMGLVAGWYGGKTEETIMRVVDFLMVLPALPLMLVLVSVFDEMEISRVWGIVMTLSLISWAGVTRLIRSQVLSVKERSFIEAAQASGVPDFHIMFNHILPNVAGLVIYQIVLSVQASILAAAALSFLQMGPRWVSFGNILQRVAGVLLGIGPTGGSTTGPTGGGGEQVEGAEAIMAAWWYILFPGLILFLFGAALIFIGMTLQKIVQKGEARAM